MSSAKRIKPSSSEPVAEHRVKISSRFLDQMKQMAPRGESNALNKNIYAPYEPPTGVLPKNTTGYKIAMDAGFDCNLDWGIGAQLNGVYDQGYAFPGFQILSQWSQIVEFRKPCEVFAREMTRKWIQFHATGEQDKKDRIKQLEEEFGRLKVQSVFRKAIEQDCLYGRSHIYIDMGDKDYDELRTPLLESKAKIGNKVIQHLTVIEPLWVYPSRYNSNNPLDPTFYKPVTWFVMANEVHSSRLSTIVTRELPDILKPAYAFSGLSLQQIMKPYIDNWLRTRQNVSDLINAFTVWTLSTDMSTMTMADGASDFYRRLELFNIARDNHGINAIDKETEAFSNVSAPLGGLDKLQAQSQEHMSAASGQPLIYSTGITPAGLNASSDSEIEVFQDTLAANQAILTPHVTKIMNIVMLTLWGEIDKDINFKWESMKVVSEHEKGEIRKMQAETDIAYCDAGILAPDEIRAQIADEEDSPYSGLDLDRVIEKPEDPSQDPEMSDFSESIGSSND